MMMAKAIEKRLDHLLAVDHHRWQATCGVRRTRTTPGAQA
jgi:hypothetical protein